ncbi:Asp-tRNA(Asn)/Glu-tRNA(Gln) amidotransferase subunit GatB [Candidatus Sumerlaeota bacterium]|nr:Asp-tRNA(Asn)/Glu-tRNA(Gln) amidotransferase subunit GatB [Candidatus Sumerlaeota bacterium]
MTANYETVVGMEVHVELLTKTKVFCGCSTDFGQPPNTQTCPVCLGMPGSLPVINTTAFEYAMRTALALNCNITSPTQFERKNYYYPDLPKNYQISQLRKNLGVDGWLEISVEGQSKKIGMDNIHLEEDAGKNIHPETPGADYSLVDLNRAGTALLEIVSKPDMRSTDDAMAYMQTLKNLLEYLEVSDCNMHEGRMRFEANISVRKPGDPLGTKVEVKNVGSMKMVAKCIEYETRRQIEEIESGGRVIQETRGWDDDKGETYSMRSKEEAQDYRYFPDPDLVEVVVDDAWINQVRSAIPELPEARRRRFIEKYGLPEYDAGVLTSIKSYAEYYETALKTHNNPKAISNWIMTEVLRILKETEQEIAAFPVKPEHLGKLVRLIDDQTISGKIAKDVFKDMLGGGGDPEKIVKDKGLVQITDTSFIEKIVDEVLAANAQSVEDFKNGKDRALGFLVGQVMKGSKGKANPGIVNELIKKKIGG